MILLFPKRGKN